jgi:uncharacterized protein (DUF1499 family)
MFFVWIGVAVLLTVLLTGAMGAVMRIDDWSRDLNTNHAATSAGADDPALRPIEAEWAVGEAAEAVQRVAANLPRWSLEGESQNETSAELRFVRRTPVFGFKDDITVRFTRREDGCLIEAESRSRIGKGDLGQNPRNLRELLSEVRESLPSVAMMRNES